MGNLLLLRFAMGAIVVAWAALRPEAVGIEFAALLGRHRRLPRPFDGRSRSCGGDRIDSGPRCSTGLLLLDGLYLAFAMYGTGGTQSPIRFLVYLDLVAVSLLASYRTGLKIALWDSLLLFVVLYAQAANLVPPVELVAGRGASSSTGCRSSTSPRSGCSRSRPRPSRRSTSASCASAAPTCRRWSRSAAGSTTPATRSSSRGSCWPGSSTGSSSSAASSSAPPTAG